jgi:nucleotide-binding universal stress UspA family protein
MTEKLFQKILVATDGSDRNRAAIEEALRIGRSCDAIVCAVYVMDLSAFESMSADVIVRDTWSMIQREADAALARIRAMADDVNLETAILEGKPAPMIVEYARKNAIDLIVIGTQGKRGLERILLGSVAESVIRSAPCRILVVK